MSVTALPAPSRSTRYAALTASPGTPISSSAGAFEKSSVTGGFFSLALPGSVMKRFSVTRLRTAPCEERVNVVSPPFRITTSSGVEGTTGATASGTAGVADGAGAVNEVSTAPDAFVDATAAAGFGF